MGMVSGAVIGVIRNVKSARDAAAAAASEKA